MKRLFALCLALWAALIPCAFGEEADASARLTVVGEAQVQLPADIAVLTLGVNTPGESVADCAAQNAAAMDRVIAALHEAGIAPEDIVTQSYTVTPVYDYEYGKLGEGERIASYQVENRLQVTMRDVAQVGATLDAAMAAGANVAYDVAFQSSQAAQAADQALAAAIAEGARKAELMAQACGQSLGALLAVTEEPYGGAGGVTVAFKAAAAGSSTPILADQLTVSAQVTLVYALGD